MKQLLAALVLSLASSVAWAAGAAGFSDEEVGEAIERGAAFLWSKQNEDGSWPDASGGLQFKNNDRQVGATSLIAYALLAKGVKVTEPRMARALKWLDAQETFWTYAVALRCQVWLEAARQDLGYRRQLTRDTRVLIQASVLGKKKRGSYGYRVDLRGGSLDDYDNSNAQYGVLGVWAAYQHDLEVPETYWKLVMQYWAACQGSDGGWQYKEDDKHSSGSMTAAGVATLFVCVDALMADQFVRCRRSQDILMLRKGLAWFDRNFVKTLTDKELCTGGHGDVYYYLFGVERVGLACGHKYFGQVDWYQVGAAYLLGEQRPDGAWQGNWGDQVATAYALLFLARGQRAVLFNWLEYDGDWNNRPRALANFCRWARGAFESDVNWQIINLKVDVSQWHDAPVLLLTGSTAPKFTDEDLQKLRTFVHQGGTLFSITECAGQGFQKGIREVYEKLFPGCRLQQLPRDHALYTINARIGGRANLLMLSNGARPLAIHTDVDLSRDWQLDSRRTAPLSFDTAANAVMYVTDRRLRNRGAVTWPGAPAAQSGPKVKLVRLKYEGNWSPEPLAWERVSRLLARRCGVHLEVAQPVAIRDLTPSTAALATLTGTDALNATDADKAALKAFVQGGGTLLIDAAGGAEGGGGAFAESAEVLVAELFGPRSLRSLATESDLYRRQGLEITKVKYSPKARAILATNAPGLKGVLLGERIGVVFSREDLTVALVGCSPYGIDGYDPESAYEIARNVVLYAGKVPPGAVRTRPDDLIANGDFEAAGTPDGAVAAGWTGGDRKSCSLQEEGGNRFLRIHLPQQGAAVLYQKFKVQPDWRAVRMSVRIRARNVAKGRKDWESGMLQYIFKDDKGEVVGDWPKRLVERDQDWQVMTDRVRAPEGAVEFEVQCQALNCRGTFDFDDVSARPVRAD